MILPLSHNSDFLGVSTDIKPIRVFPEIFPTGTGERDSVPL